MLGNRVWATFTFYSLCSEQITDVDEVDQRERAERLWNRTVKHAN